MYINDKNLKVMTEEPTPGLIRVWKAWNSLNSNSIVTNSYENLTSWAEFFDPIIQLLLLRIWIYIIGS